MGVTVYLDTAARRGDLGGDADAAWLAGAVMCSCRRKPFKAGGGYYCRLRDWLTARPSGIITAAMIANVIRELRASGCREQQAVKEQP
jgi:hypothetical protein